MKSGSFFICMASCLAITSLGTLSLTAYFIFLSLRILLCGISRGSLPAWFLTVRSPTFLTRSNLTSLSFLNLNALCRGLLPNLSHAFLYYWISYGFSWILKSLFKRSLHIRNWFPSMAAMKGDSDVFGSIM